MQRKVAQLPFLFRRVIAQDAIFHTIFLSFFYVEPASKATRFCRLVRWFAYFFTKIIKSVKGVGFGDVSDAINQVSVVIIQAWDATNEASDGTTDAWDGVNQASDEATEAWDAINEAANASTEAWDGTNDAWDAINQAWVMTNEAWDEANQASVMAVEPRKVAKNAFFTCLAA